MQLARSRCVSPAALLKPVVHEQLDLSALDDGSIDGEKRQGEWRPLDDLPTAARQAYLRRMNPLSVGLGIVVGNKQTYGGRGGAAKFPSVWSNSAKT